MFDWTTKPQKNEGDPESLSAWTVILLAYLLIMSMLISNSLNKADHVTDSLQSVIDSIDAKTEEIEEQPDTIIIRSTKNMSVSYRGGMKEYLHSIALFESGNQLDAINNFGFLGKYQFSPRTLQSLDMDVSTDEFLVSDSLQDVAMRKLLTQNSKSLKSIIRKYNGTYHNGILVTTSGILAGAHLSGVGGVLSYFYPERYDYSTSDSNGATVELYMRKFSRYKVNL